MKARIYKPGKSAMQSGRGKANRWILEYELATPRQPEALMGWSASGDTLNQVRLNFSTREEAEAFAVREGLAFTVLRERERRIKPRNYSDNFRYIPQEEQESA